jgi:hypothetical protein
MNSKLAPNLPTTIIKDTEIKIDNDQKIQIKMNANPNYCIDNGNSKMAYPWDCIQNTNQQYIYNPIKKQLLDPNKNLCLDVDSSNKMTWSKCDESKQSQQYLYNSTTNQITNSNNLQSNLQSNMCMDINTNNISNGSSSLILNKCSNNINQKFTPYLISKSNLEKYILDLINKIQSYTDPLITSSPLNKLNDYIQMLKNNIITTQNLIYDTNLQKNIQSITDTVNNIYYTQIYQNLKDIGIKYIIDNQTIVQGYLNNGNDVINDLNNKLSSYVNNVNSYLKLVQDTQNDLSNRYSNLNNIIVQRLNSTQLFSQLVYKSYIRIDNDITNAVEAYNKVGRDISDYDKLRDYNSKALNHISGIVNGNFGLPGIKSNIIKIEEIKTTITNNLKSISNLNDDIYNKILQLINSSSALPKAAEPFLTNINNAKNNHLWYLTIINNYSPFIPSITLNDLGKTSVQINFMPSTYANDVITVASYKASNIFQTFQTNPTKQCSIM